MKIEKVWLVRNPTAVSTLEDICWEQEVCRLGRYVWGSGQGVWEEEETTMFVDETEARADARARLEARGRETRGAARRMLQQERGAAPRTGDDESAQRIVDAMELPDLGNVGDTALIDWPAGVPWGSYETRRGAKSYELRLPELVHPAYVVRTE
jgi:hypothetical protein